MAEIVQYSIVIRTSSGAHHRDRPFLIPKRLCERVMSAKRPKPKVMVDTRRPIIVRYW